MDIKIVRLSPRNWLKYCDQIDRIEEASYEAARKDSISYLHSILLKPGSRCFVAVCQGKAVGFCFGASLEAFPDVDGTRTDPEWNKGTTFYSANLAVDSKYRRRGIASALKQRQIQETRSQGYSFLAGRNRVGLAEGMIELNASLGAYEVQRIANYYQDDLDPKDLTYYHIDLDRLSSTV
ncbi:MAG: GNAT family N-acetyltransferase [Dehalococcoidia bacterium]